MIWRRRGQRAHILEGLLIALDNLDEVIDLIRRSRTVETARANLMKQFKLQRAAGQGHSGYAAAAAGGAGTTQDSG